MEGDGKVRRFILNITTARSAVYSIGGGGGALRQVISESLISPLDIVYA